MLHRPRQGGPSRLLRLHHLGRRKQVSITFEIPAKFVLKYSPSFCSERKFSHVYSTGCMGKTSEILKVVCEGFSAALASSKAFHQVRVECWDVYCYRTGLTSGLPVAKIFQPSRARGGKQQQDPNPPNLGPTFLAHPTTFDTVFLTSRWVGS